jgi:hypothetical protein
VTTAVATRLPTLAGAVHSNCHCLRCRLGYNDWLADRRQQVAAGTWQPFVDAGPAREHINKLHTAGMSLPVIATLAKLPLVDIRRVWGDIGSRPRARRIRPETARAILAVELHFSRLPATAYVPSRGAARRIQALRAIGWPAKEIVRRVGLSDTGIYSLRFQKQIRVGTHLAIAALYEVLFDQDPAEHGIDPVIVRRTRRYAADKHWAVPAAWTDIDTDDRPNGKIRSPRFPKAVPGARKGEVLDETAHLAAFGFTQEQIAARIGITWNAIEQAHLRAGTALPYIAPTPRTERDSHV